MGAREFGVRDGDVVEVGAGKHSPQARAAVRQPADENVAQLGLAPVGDFSAVVATDLLVHLVWVRARYSRFARGAVSRDCMLAEVERVVEGTLTALEGAPKEAMADHASSRYFFAGGEATLTMEEEGAF